MSRSLYLSWALAILVAIAGCETRGANSRKADEDRYPKLETVQPHPGALPVHIEVSAVVEAMEKAELCARVPGVIESLQPDPSRPEVDIGRPIKAGEPLVQLAVPDLVAEKVYKESLLDQAKKQKEQTLETRKVAEKELEEARALDVKYQAEFQRSQEKHDRTAQMVASRTLAKELAEESKQQLEAARAGWQAARAQIATKQARLAAADADLKLADARIEVAQAEVNRLKVLVGYATITAPFDGLVTRRLVDRGAMVKDPSTPLLTVARIDRVRVLLDIPQRHVPLINTTEQNPNPNGRGDVAVLRIPELRDLVPGGEFPGHLTRMASALDPVTRTMRVEVHLENKAGDVLYPLKPGMHGTATVWLDEGTAPAGKTTVVTVPSAALMRRGSKVYVFCVANVQGAQRRGVLKRVEVQLGLDDGKRVEIHGGLSGQELVIAKGNGVLRDGDTVIAVDSSDTLPVTR
jgi:RND family efflux transporter MFP subunit